MVARLDGLAQTLWYAPALLAAADKQAEPLLVRLDPASRAKVLMAILGLVVLGAALLAMIWLGARWVRRLAREPMRSTSPRQDDWYRKPLSGDAPNDSDSDETP